MLDAATAFGLTRDEVWGAFRRTLDALPPDFYEEDCMDEIAAALAHEILAKQRRIFAARRS